jgi:hypothetical protein
MKAEFRTFDVKNALIHDLKHNNRVQVGLVHFDHRILRKKKTERIPRNPTFVFEKSPVVSFECFSCVIVVVSLKVLQTTLFPRTCECHASDIPGIWNEVPDFCVFL